MKKVQKINCGDGTANYKFLVFKSQLFKNSELRVFVNRKIYWFIATDVAKILEYKQFDKIAKTFVEDKNKKYYKDTNFYSSGGSPFKNLVPISILINKEGINNVIAKSRSKNVKIFKEWIEKDVFPKLKEEEFEGEEEELVDESEEVVVDESEEDVVDESEEEVEEEEENNKLPLISNDKKPLVLNTIEITTRKVDDYINLTALCKAGNKDFKHWKENKKTKGFLHVLSSSVGIPTDGLLKYETSSNENRATWGHPQVAINIAQWISPEFDVQVSKWIFELLITGKVELGKEKSNEELENIYKEKLLLVENQLENTKVELKAITNTHNNMLKRQKRTAYEIGNVIYIVSNKAFTMYCNDECYKFGKASQTRDETTSTFTNRLSTYNTCSPINFDVEFLIYVEDNTLVENNIKARFRKDINPTNKEWLKGVKLSIITEYIVSLCELTNIEYNVVIDNSKTIQVEEQVKVEEVKEEVEVEVEVEEEEEEEVKKYKKILNELDTYLKPKLVEIAKELKLIFTGTKDAILDRIKISLQKTIKMHKCKYCKKYNIADKRSERCVECARILARKVVRPSYEQLQEDMRQMSMVNVGKKYGVSDNAIRKWIKAYRS